jgi:hypothetical protein
MQNPLSIEWKESLNISSSLRRPLSRSYSALRRLLTFALLFSFVFFVNSAFATGTPKQIGKDLYASIADNDAIANSTFLVGNAGILVVDSGLDEIEAGKCVAEIRSVSSLPIRYVVSTHYHLDHQGGNKIFKPEASIISTGWTRMRTIGDAH